MKLHEEFSVVEPLEGVWRFFERPQSVAACLPGVERLTVVDDDNVHVVATQSIGPLTATFEAKVTVLERVPNELIRFRAIGRSVRGASGNLRSENTVMLHGSTTGTTVTVDGDVILAGALGSVGQKVVAKQASKVTAEFAANLQRALDGGAASTIPTVGRAGTVGAVGGTAAASGGARAPTIGGPTPHTVGGAYEDGWPPSPWPPPDRWSRVAAALSGVSVVLGLLALLRQRRERT